MVEFFSLFAVATSAWQIFLAGVPYPLCVIDLFLKMYRKHENDLLQIPLHVVQVIRLGGGHFGSSQSTRSRVAKDFHCCQRLCDGFMALNEIVGFERRGVLHARQSCAKGFCAEACR